MQTPDIPDNLEALLACGPLKAWSVIVTVLGDLCTTREDSVGGRFMQDIVGQMGIADQTMRVALHRLRKDGWIESVKRGRDAEYALSDVGWRETQAVRGRIYNAAPEHTGPVKLVVGAPDMTAAKFTEALPEGSVQIAQRTALLQGNTHGTDEFWCVPVTIDTLPKWVATILADDVLCTEYDTLAGAAEQVAKGPVPQDPAGAMALRILTLHHWRRLRLRHSALPDLLLGSKWSGALARRQVMAVLNRIERVNT